MRPLTLLRRAAVTIFTLLLLLFAFVQFQQRLLRHRAERLHAEILALQLHPGAFADIQRLQKEWGRFAHYEGECTQHHCIYEIGFRDVFQQTSRQMWHHISSDKFSDVEQRRISRALEVSSLLYRGIGGRPAFVYADLEVRDNRMWGAGFSIGAYNSPGVGRNEGHEYVIGAHTGLNSRILYRELYDPKFLLLGYSDELTLNCLGCETVSATFTAQTEPEIIQRLNQFNFACLGPWHACMHPANMAPQLTAQATLDQKLPSAISEIGSDASFCKVPVAVRAREAEDIVLVRIVSAQLHTAPGSGQQYQNANGSVERKIKNGSRTAFRSSIDLVMIAPTLRFELAQVWKKQDRIYLLYREPLYGESEVTHEIKPCNALLETPANFAAIQSGIALDASSGEPWDWYNGPGEPWFWP